MDPRKSIREAIAMKDWKTHFLPVILSRGQNYYSEGRVVKIWQDIDLIRAVVEGTEDYEVWIDPIDISGRCTCPYALNGAPCKHMAAVFAALDAGEIVYQECPPVPLLSVERKLYELPWLKAIDELPEALLRKEMMRLADQDGHLQERLSILYANGLPEGVLDDWRTDLRETVNEYTDRRGYIDREECQMLIWTLGDFINVKLPLLLKLKAAEDAFSVVKLAKEAVSLRPIYEDQQDFLFGLREDCKEAIQQIIPIASNALAEEMNEWLDASFGRIPAEGVFPQYEVEFNHPTLVLTPFYRCVGSKDEWKEVPRRGEAGYFYDPIELHPDYEKIEEAIDRAARRVVGYGRDSQKQKEFWEVKKKLLKERYQILWHSFADLNPNARYD